MCLGKGSACETIWHPGCWLHSKVLLVAVSEALSLSRVGSATGVDAGATLGHGMVDRSGLQPDLASGPCHSQRCDSFFCGGHC